MHVFYYYLCLFLLLLLLFMFISMTRHSTNVTSLNVVLPPQRHSLSIVSSDVKKIYWISAEILCPVHVGTPLTAPHQQQDTSGYRGRKVVAPGGRGPAYDIFICGTVKDVCGCSWRISCLAIVSVPGENGTGKQMRTASQDHTRRWEHMA